MNQPDGGNEDVNVENFLKMQESFLHDSPQKILKIKR